MFSVLLVLLVLGTVAGNSAWLFQSEDKWDKQWAMGQWAYMDTVPIERSKVAVVGVLADMYANASSESISMGVLDVGCGEGSLSDFLPKKLRDGYVGTDISKEAILAARRKRPTVKFVHSAAHKFKPKNGRKFQVITFADMLYYYMKDHRSLLQQYSEYLTDNGVLIISIFFTKEKSELYSNIWRDAADVFERVDTIKIFGSTRKMAHSTAVTETDTAFRIEVFRKKNIFTAKQTT